MTVDFDSLMGRHSLADIKSSLTAACEAVGFHVSRLPPLSRLRKLALDAVPVIADMATGINADAIRGGLLDYAEGVWVDLLAVNLFGLDGRIEETFATPRVTFTNTTANVYNFAAGEVVVGNGIVTYTVNQRFALAAAGNDGDEVTVDAIASAAGSAGSAEAGTITEMVKTLDGVEVTNAAAAYGSDRETDTQLKERCRLAHAALSNAGHVAAIELVARSARREDGTAIGVTRVQVLEHVPTVGDVKVFLADGDGPPSADDITRIDYLLRTLVIPTGVNYLGTFGATPVNVVVSYTAQARERDGATGEELEELVSAALLEMFAEHPIGGYVPDGPEGWLYMSEIVATISQVQVGENGPRPIKNVVLASAMDIELEPGEVAVLGDIFADVELI
jgi:hypothetical protein